MNHNASYLTSSIGLVITLSAPAAFAQQTNEADVEKISVIGSRLSVRSATESTAPVDIIGSAELQATGMTETARALQFLVPSFNFPTSSITDGSDAVRPASLRGLSPDHTLVLINGKRRHGSALVHLNGTMGRGSSNVDLNAIPMSAIKRIEILRDGAAAQYGSDAIAGVINLVLNDNMSGGQVSLNGGQTFEGDGEQYKISSNQGFRIAEDGFVNISAEYHHKNKTNRAGLDPRQQYADINNQPDPREAIANRLNHSVGDASFENLALMVNAGYQLANSEFYAFADLSQRKTQSGAFFRRPLDARNVVEVYPDGFLPEIAPETNDHAITLGYKFELADWQLDLSANTGASRYQYYVNNSLNASLGPASPTSAYAGGMRNDEQNLNLEASKLFAFVNESDFVLSAGIAYRKNSYKIFQGDEVSYANYGYQGKSGGMQGFGGFTPESTVDESRNNLGVYVEVENQLTDKFNWAAAVRQERYSDFGSNTSWKLAGRYELTPEWAVRSTFNSGFRAPSVQQLYFSNLSTLFVADPVTGVLNPVESGTFNNTSPVVSALGQGELKPEKSQSISVGITYQGDNGVTFTLDSYRIEIDDRIILTGSVSRANPIIDGLLGTNSAESVRFFTNAVDTRTQGVEAVLAYQLPQTEYGDIKLSLSAQYNDTDIKQIKVPALLGGLEEALFNNEEKARLTKANPKNSFSAGITHSYGDFITNLRINRFGPYTLGYATGDYQYSAKTVADISLSYAFNSQLGFTVGVNNLFDTYPDEQPVVNQFNGIFKYPNTNAPFGFNGGYYFVEARYLF
ncbi:TonB-dependent receptor [Rheinheimera sp. MMS21-TC3]|uniref:TonB-dependent receptor plug domain-containing protein n=1 Tax=Rheinheimera sp. MMS21-TC3 TaxID=3072790 RepID=UPI0028C3B915|nr:TonB-dependent receptor [Rheinheimera sp. MMS21-TC3]WNO59742.1 TonB-dependent receptor [Rheinheimera sp. MMS21-TC3]